MLVRKSSVQPSGGGDGAGGDGAGEGGGCDGDGGGDGSGGRSGDGLCTNVTGGCAGLGDGGGGGDDGGDGGGVDGDVVTTVWRLSGVSKICAVCRKASDELVARLDRIEKFCVEWVPAASTGSNTRRTLQRGREHDAVKGWVVVEDLPHR